MILKHVQHDIIQRGFFLIIKIMTWTFFWMQFHTALSPETGWDYFNLEYVRMLSLSWITVPW